jgi:hypothetical protein
MIKLLLIMIVMAIAVQLLACTVEPILPTQATPESTPIQTALTVPKVTVEEVKQKMDSGFIFILVDVRSKTDYDKGHIVRAVSIPIQALPGRYTEISQESEIIVYGACT